MKSLSLKKLLSIVGAVLLVLFLAFGLYEAYHYFYYDRERNAFQKIDKDMNGVIVRIESDNTIANVQETKYCRNDQEKYGGGQLRCLISVSANINNTENERANAVDNFVQALKVSGFIQQTPLNYKGQYDTGQFLHQPTGSSCHPSYRVLDDGTLTLSFYCVRPARKAIFPKL